VTEVPDLAHDCRTLRAVKKPLPLAVAFAAAEGSVQTLEGKVTYHAGDAVLTGTRGERWPVGRAAFLASYDPLAPTQRGENGRYVKRPQPVLALQLDTSVEVAVGWQSDTLRGRPGDWLLRYADGSHGVVSDDIFRETYEVLS
jgi:hypothetical protein